MIRIARYVGWSLAAASGYGALYLAANRAVYYPMRYPQGEWEVQAELHAQDVWLHAGGPRLHAWWVPQPGARFATLFLHGNAGNITHREYAIRAITAAGSSILLPDYRGYGKSEGRPSEKGLYTDALAAYQYLRDQGYAPQRIILHGESLGTAVAVDLASRHPCAGVVLEAAFSSARDVAGTVLPVLGPLLVWSYNSRKKIRNIHAPSLFIHGDRDDIIPIRFGRALFDAAPQPKSFWVVPGAGHNDIVDAAGPQYRQHLAGFYNSLP